MCISYDGNSINKSTKLHKFKSVTHKNDDRYLHPHHKLGKTIGRPPEAIESTSEDLRKQSEVHRMQSETHRKTSGSNRKSIGRPPEIVPSGHAHSEKYKRSSRELILVLDFVKFTSIV